VVLLSLVSTLVGAAGWFTARRTADAAGRATASGLGLVGVGCLVIALVPALDPVTGGLDHAAGHLPALGLLRDSDRFLGPAVLPLLPGVALVTAALWRRGRLGARALHAVAVLLVAWPVLCLPSMAWGLGGQLRPVDYPREWSTVADLLARPGSPGVSSGATVVLPWHGTYRAFAWNAHRAQLDPAPRYLPGDVLIDDRIFLGHGADAVVLSNEDPMLAAVTTALRGTDPGGMASALRRLGIAHVVVEKDNGVRPADVPAGTVVHDGAGLTLVDLGPSAGPDGRGVTRRIAIVGGDVGAGLIVLVALGELVRRQVYGDRRHKVRE
jgi:hypothetical protein